MLWGHRARPLLCLELLSRVLMEVTSIPVEDGLCSTIPCVLEFSKTLLSVPESVGNGLNASLSVPAAGSGPRVATGGDSGDRVLTTGNLEEQDCVLLIHETLRRDSRTDSFYTALGGWKGAILRENIQPPASDLTRQPERLVVGSLEAGDPVTLTCIIQGPCEGNKALLSWKVPTVSPNTTVSSDSSRGLHATPKPEDQGATFPCLLNFSLGNLSRSSVVNMRLAAPPKLLNFSCRLTKTLRCSCSFHGLPTPSVQWWVEGTPVSASSMDTILQVTSDTMAPWANSTLLLKWEPEIIRRLRCEGRNQYGVHAFRIFLIPSESSASSVFLKGLIQGIVYGAIAVSLLFFFLVMLVAWWGTTWRPAERVQDRKADSHPVSGQVSKSACGHGRSSDSSPGSPGMPHEDARLVGGKSSWQERGGSDPQETSGWRSPEHPASLKPPQREAQKKHT